MADEHRCRACGADMLAKWIRMRMRDPRVEVGWQLASRFCIDCHLLRHAAAHEYELAAGEVRLWMSLGAEPRGQGAPRRGSSEITAAMHRVRQAEERCVALGIWPAERKFRRPPWFYDDERSDTE